MTSALTAPARPTLALALALAPTLADGRKTADQILDRAAQRADAAGDIVAAFKLRRMAEQARLAALRSLQ